MKRAVVNVEALVQAHLALQENAADESPRLVPMRLQHGWQSDSPRRHALRVFFNLVLKWVCGCEQRCMRGKSERNLRFDVTEQGAPLRERIDVGSADAPVAVCAQVVGAQRVD